MRLLAAIAVAICMTRAIQPSFLAELARRRVPEEQQVEQREEAIRQAAESCQRLRSIFVQHPKQKRCFESKHKRKAWRKTRRAGATTGGVRELLARSLEIPKHRAVYITTTRDEAKKRAWESDTQSGFVDVLKELAIALPKRGVPRYEIGGVTIEVREQDLALEFSNGSKIELFAADDDASLDKLRGLAKHVYWIDEAQDFPGLERLWKAVIIAGLADFGGECWLSGTPGKDPVGLFFDVTNEEAPLAGWEVHEVACTDNPYFGVVVEDHGQWFVADNLGVKHGPYPDEAQAEAAAVQIRWNNTAGKALADGLLTQDDPDFIREWLGKWVKGDARYVYPVQSVPEHVLVFAPQRLADNPIDRSHAKWFDFELAYRDLPRRPTGRTYEWLFSIGADFGYAATPFALTMWAFTFDRPDIFEMISWKQHKVLPDDQRKYIEALYGCTNNIVAMVGDPAGQKAADLEAWRTRFDLPIDDADKAAKNTWQTLMAGDIRKGLVRYRKGSPIFVEHTHLVYLPTKPGKTNKDDEFRRLSNGTVPGNDCADAGLYAYKYLHHHRFRDGGTDERTDAQKQADAYEAAIDRSEEIREAIGEGQIDEIEGGYSW